jgi:alpha-L-rhamnosidase
VTDEPAPRLSWKLLGKISRNPVLGYQVIAASTKSLAEKGKGDYWQSGFLPIENGPWVLYDASKLPSRSEVWWRVRPVFEYQKFGEWSEIGVFETGLKNQDDWTGKWIGMNPEQRKRSAPFFRNSFEIQKPVSKARLYVCGLGYHESWINDKKLGDEVLQPAQTDYHIRSFYVAHDVTVSLQKGQNTLGFWLGDGFYNQNIAFGKNGLSYGEPRIIAQLEITFQDGSKSIIVTDEDWKCRNSAIISSNIFAGEKYDARSYQSNWASNNLESEKWEKVEIVSPPGGKLIAQQLPPCRKLGHVPVKKVDELRPGVWVFDFGQNLVGWAKMKVDASPGTVVTIRFAENRLPSGELGFASSGVRATKVIQTDTYICKGNGEEIWEPRFTYHGFRFAEVRVSSGVLKNKKPGKDFLEGIVIHTDMGISGEFECSDATLNKAFQLAHWTQIGNIQGVPTDCPIRERCGWTGDAHNTVPYTMNRFHAASMWRKYIEDIVTTAQVTGRMLCFGDEINERTVQIKEVGIPTMVAPGKRFIGEGSPDWGCAIAFIPWDIYVRTGDDRSLKKHYISIRQWTEHLKKLSVSGIVYSGMGDWCKPILNPEPGASDKDLFGDVSPMLSTACYYRSVRITADAAKLMGKGEDFEYYDALAMDIRTAFTKAFYGDEPELVPDQTINAIAINWNVLDPKLHPKVAQILASQVEEAGCHFMTGVFGMPSLWPVLGKFGFHETAWKALQVENAPSLKYLLKRGASTFWEKWPIENDEGEEYTRSMSHPFQGGFVAWFFEGLAGINPDVDLPGYKLIHLEPQIFEGLDWVKCRYNSSMGTIESSWKKEGGTLIWNIEIPPGAKAKLRIPGRLVKIEGKINTSNSIPVQADDAQGKAQKMELSSGKYEIRSEM